MSQPIKILAVVGIIVGIIGIVWVLVDIGFFSYFWDSDEDQSHGE